MPKARENTLPKARENAGNQDVIGFYFAYDWLRERERGASFLDQSQSGAKENQLNTIRDYFWNAIENCSRAKIFPVVYVMETEIIYRSSVDFICNIP